MGRMIKSIAYIVAGVLTGIAFNSSLDLCMHFLRDLYFGNIKIVKRQDNLYSSEELNTYNGKADHAMIYVSFMGTIYDVSQGRKHYGPGASYNYFAGKDGTRAFITGDFSDESDKKDHILDLTCDELLGLENWKKTLKEKYDEVGFHIGRYYDKDGKQTEYYIQYMERISQCKKQKQEQEKESQNYPPCNIAWSADEGTRVWCTKSSGGITRDWIGVPRLKYSPGSELPHCVCVNETTMALSGMFKEYENCSSTSTSCILVSDSNDR